MRGIIVKAPPGISAEMEAVSAKTGCGKKHLAKLFRASVLEFIAFQWSGKVLEQYRESLPQKEMFEVEANLKEPDEEEAFV